MSIFSVEPGFIVTEATQTELPSTSSASVQSEKHLSGKSPRKQKLRKIIRMQRHKLSKLLCNPESSSSKLPRFLGMYDEYLSPQSSTVIKFHAQVRSTARYPTEYRQFALNLYFLGPKVNRYIEKLLHLPNSRTFRRWTQHWNVAEGISDFMFMTIDLKCREYNETARQCVLCMDEMALKANLFYILKRDEIVEFAKSQPAKSMMVLFAKGILENWKQPVAHVFVHTTCNGT
ncbi:Transposase protein [Popillia japonica]|uniref:Transposase protein n=1 Tax=Popillia japonica TaxID=7064 RepID=A0AAW1IAB1_POPJA